MHPEISLRAPEPYDIDRIYLWENSTDELHTTLRTGPLSRHQIEDFVLNYDGELYTRGALRFMIDADGETVGTIDIFDYDHRARHAFVGIFIAPAYRRRHIGSQALKLIERHVYRAVGMYSVAAIVAEDNEASRALFTTAGYTAAGILRGWLVDGMRRVDAILFEHLL